jgi:hypothetical protein
MPLRPTSSGGGALGGVPDMARTPKQQVVVVPRRDRGGRPQVIWPSVQQIASAARPASLRRRLPVSLRDRFRLARASLFVGPAPDVANLFTL